MATTSLRVGTLDCAPARVHKCERRLLLLAQESLAGDPVAARLVEFRFAGADDDDVSPERLRRDVHRRECDTFAAHVARRLFPWPEQRALYEAAVASLAATSRGAYLAAMQALARFDARGQVAAIRQPTLIVAGDRDTSVPLAAKVALAASIPRARLLVVPGSGHATPHDQPAAFNHAMLEFFAAH